MVVGAPTEFGAVPPRNFLSHLLSTRILRLKPLFPLAVNRRICGLGEPEEALESALTGAPGDFHADWFPTSIPVAISFLCVLEEPEENRAQTAEAVVADLALLRSTPKQTGFWFQAAAEAAAATAPRETTILELAVWAADAPVESAAWSRR